MADRAVAWCERFDQGTFGAALRDMRKKAAAAVPDVDFATFRAAQADAPPAEEPPDPARAEATAAMIDALALSG